MTVVGIEAKRIDGPRKLTGVERYAGDLRFPGLLFARPVGSPYAHARMRHIDKEPALDVPGVAAVLTGNDLPIARDESGALIKTLIADEEALYAGQIVALVLAESESAAEDGVQAVGIYADPLPVVNTLDQAMDFQSPSVSASSTSGGEDEAGMHNADAVAQQEAETEELAPNVSNVANFSRGDIERGFRQADAIVELTLDSLTVHQGYLETQVCLVNIGPLGDIEVFTSTQAAFYCRTRVAETVGYPVHKVKVTATPVGGGFGGKFVLIEPLVAAAAIAVGRPVMLQYTRMEDFVAGNPAPDAGLWIRLGAKKDGSLTAIQARTIFDSGATGSAPMEIGSILLGGYYKVPNLEIKGYAVHTHKAGGGAYRAPGAQQGSFAIESAIDELARELGFDPIEFRLKNCVEEGDLRPNDRPWPRIGLRETLEALQKHPAWKERSPSNGHNPRGVGIAIGGWPGGVEPATAVCRLDADGTFTVVVGTSDLTGTSTAFAQIAANEIGVSLNEIQLSQGDTSSAPYSGGTGGSKITYTVGAAVQQAAAEARKQVLSIASQHLEAAIEDLEIADGQVRVRGVPTSAVSLKEIASMCMSFGAKYEPVYGSGSTAITDIAPGFAAHLCEVTVDADTGLVQVERYVAAQDVGFAINPALVDSQIQGAVAQGIGWALYEGLAFDEDGQPLTASLMDYALPKSRMIPQIETIHVEIPSEHGAYGAKGVGEPPAIPGPAAVANAIRDAVGARVTSLPMRPEVVLQAIKSANGSKGDGAKP
jgi:CO/xanthine dehydrogenase Mo-binding subunit